MNIFDIINDTLNEDEEVIMTEEDLMNEGLFDVSPIVAMYAFKQKVFKKFSNNGFAKVRDKVEGAVGSALGKKESLKAKLGLKSGKGENATVYSLTTEQRKVLAEMYNKYGKSLYKQIMDFRNNVIAPYQIIKRNVANNQKLTDKEVNGLTKDEFYKYRESGRKKIEKRGTFFSDFKGQQKKVDDTREAIKEARNKLQDFESGKNTKIDPENMEKILDRMNIGTNKLNNWSLDELSRTYEEINKLNKLLSDPSKISGDKVRVGTYKNTNKGNSALYSTIDEVKSKISKLMERGISYVNNSKKKTSDNELKKGSFAEAYAVYVLRKGKLQELKNNSTDSEFKRIYTEVLKNAIKAAEDKNNEEFSNYVGMRKDIDLNEYEKKIWGLLPTTTNKWSGDIADYYQKIKEEDFKGTRYFKKPEKVVAAEKEIDAAVKRFEREIEKIVSPEDLQKLKKYRLINNPITVKELKSPGNLFKSDSELKDTVERKEETITSEEFGDELDKYIATTFDSFKELDEAKNRVRSMRANISKETEAENRDKMNYFLQRRTLKAVSLPGLETKIADKENKVGVEDLQNLANQIISKEYYNSEQVENDRTKFGNLVNEYNKQNQDAPQAEVTRVESLKTSVENKLNSFEKEKANE